jgi:hypothetical protein
VLLLADGGLGKSRLLEALLHDEGPAVLARARPGDAASPYGTMVTWLGQARDRFAPALAPPVRDELARLLPALGQPPQGEADQRRLSGRRGRWGQVSPEGLQSSLSGPTCLKARET